MSTASYREMQDLSSHLRGVLATQAVLEGMGVGRAGSTPLAATLQWMARDGRFLLPCLGNGDAAY